MSSNDNNPFAKDAPVSRKPRRLARRLFLISAAVLGGGLAVGAGYLGHKRATNKSFVLRPTLAGGKGEGVDTGVGFGAWLTIDKQGLITAYSPHQEMGQGIMSLIASLVAEELDAKPSQMRVAAAPVVPAYANATMLLDGLPFKEDDKGFVATSVRAAMRHVIEAIGINATGGSTATRNVIDSVQRTAAAARGMLLRAAASKLGVSVDALSIAQGVISDKQGRRLGFGDVAVEAAKLAVETVEPKPRSAYKMLGKTGMPRVDVPAKVDGSAQFGIDVRLPGMLYAAIRHCPTFGGALKSVKFADKPAGIKQTVEGKTYVAAIGTSWYAAKQFLDRAEVSWDEGALKGLTSEDIFKRYEQAIDAGAGRVFEARGDVVSLKDAQTGDVTATYRVPFLAHATMEPLNGTAWIRPAQGDLPASCELWSGNQGPILAKWLLADIAGVESEHMMVHTPYLGGGFGGRAELAVAREVIEIAKAVTGTPVMTIWSREEDMQHDAYRPAAMARMTARLDKTTGLPTQLKAHLACPSVSAGFMQRLMGRAGGADTDKANAEGVKGMPYAMPNIEVRHTVVDAGVPVGFWRSVGHSQNNFFSETFIDECARAAGKDPLEYRLTLLRAAQGAPGSDAEAKAQRFIKVLEAAASKAQWGTPLVDVAGAKVARGIAIAESFHSIVAEVAEVVVGPGDALRVRRVVAAVDCGFALDPVNVVAQVRGGVHFGLSAALYGRIDIDAGRVKQSNFTDYRMVTLADAPQVDVVIVNSGAALGGIGEVGVPPLAPAVANAVFAATGKPVRSLPLRA